MFHWTLFHLQFRRMLKHGRGPGSVMLGFILLAGSVVFTYVSYQQRAAHGYFLIPCGGVAIGLGYLTLGLTAPRVHSGYDTRARAAQTEEIEALTLPNETAPGICWQCGERVRVSNRICTSCGATQKRPRE